MKAVILDLLGVVYPNMGGGSRGNILKLYGSMPHEGLDFEVFYARYLRFKRGEIGRREFWGAEGTETDDIERKHLDAYRLYEKMPELAGKLRIRFYLAAASNHPKEWADYLRAKHKLDVFFKEMFISGELGIEKTDDRFFEKVLDELGLEGGDCVLVDDQKKNLAAAARLGIRTIHLKVKDEENHFKPDATISSLSGLEGALKSLFPDPI